MRHPSSTTGKILAPLILILVLILLIVLGGTAFYGTRTIHDLLGENKKLKEAISNLTQEDQIGYAKVLDQYEQNGELFTVLRFVQTDRDDPTRKILEREYVIRGDVVHFDALIITFADASVMAGKERSLYLWRRVYGERMAPSDGYTIEEPSEEPARYRDWLKDFSEKDRDLFWEAMWGLANDPAALREYGIKAVYGSAVYKRLRPGLIYVFKLSNTGQFYPEVVPDL